MFEVAPRNVSSCERRSFLNIATEMMADPRNRYVVLKPVCTPVPPVRYGYAAGNVGYAPPRIRVVTGGHAYPGSQRQHSRQHIVPKKDIRHRARIINGDINARSLAVTRIRRFPPFFWDSVPSPLPPRSERSGCPGASAVPWDCSPSQTLSLPGATRVLWVRSNVSRPGSG